MVEFHHFLGLTSYYRSFIPLFNDIPKPLNKLLKKGTKFQWSAQFQSTFEHLHKALCVKPIIQYPNTEKVYTLFTETSHYAYSGVLTEAVDGPDDLRPITYTSDSFSDKQQRWSATEKEAFVVYQSILKFDLYLKGAECILHSDHKPLHPFLSKGMKMPNLD